MARMISEEYPYIASRVLTDYSQGKMQEALRRLALTSNGHVCWDWLEGLVETAKGSNGYNITVILDQLSNYLLSDNG